MIRTGAALGALAAVLAPAAAVAQEPEFAPRQAVGADLFASTDADNTSVIRTGVNLDLDYRDPEHYRGVRLEKAWFEPVGDGWKDRTRVYARGADQIGGWKWNASVGTDGDTVLGSAGIHDESRFRKEFFLERDIVETRQGLSRGIYYTFGGVALDLPVDDRNLFTLVGGLQKFTGDNLRTHLRANYVHVLKPDWGLSAQLRTRYFRNSDPREFDYYSPRWYVQVLPVLQVRRTLESGWQYLVAGGVGGQKDSNSGWHRSSYFNAQLTSPKRRKWSLTSAFLFSETPTTSGNSYNYAQFTLGVTRAF